VLQSYPLLAFKFPVLRAREFVERIHALCGETRCAPEGRQVSRTN